MCVYFEYLEDNSDQEKTPGDHNNTGRCSPVEGDGSLHPLQNSLANIVSWKSNQAGGGKHGLPHWSRLGQQTLHHEKEIYSYSNGDLEEWKAKWLSHVWLFVTPWIIQSMEFSRPEYWGRLFFASSGDLPNPGTEPRSPSSQADSLPAEPKGKPDLEAGFLYKSHQAHHWIFKQKLKKIDITYF